MSVRNYLNPKRNVLKDLVLQIKTIERILKILVFEKGSYGCVTLNLFKNQLTFCCLIICIYDFYEIIVLI